MTKIISILMLLSEACFGSTWYASGIGNSIDGTSDNPWSIRFAFTNSLLSSGDTVLFKNGSFTCTDYSATYDASNVIVAACSGNAFGKIAYKSENLWGFTFNGGIVIPYTSSNLVFQNLHFDFNQSSRVRSNIWEYPAGLAIFGSNVVVSHCLIENFSIGIADWKFSRNKNVYGNISRFNGLNDWTPTYSGANRGPGVYAENQYGTARFTGNIFYGNYTEGVLMAQELTGFNLTNNVLVGGETSGLLFETRNSPSSGANIVSNFTWNGFNGSGIQIGYTDPSSINSSNVFLTGNVIVGGVKGLSFFNRWKSATVNSNMIVLRGIYGDGGSGFATEYNIVQLESFSQTNTPSYIFGGNSYYAPSSSINNFMFWGTNLSWGNWQSAANDSGSSLTTSLPTEISAYAFVPGDDLDFVHVVIYNWATNDSCNVNLNGFFNTGDKLEIYDAQNIPTSYTNLNYENQVSLNLILTNKASMRGQFSNPSLPWNGFDPRFRVFVIRRTNIGKSIRSQIISVGTTIIR